MKNSTWTLEIRPWLGKETSQSSQKNKWKTCLGKKKVVKTNHFCQCEIVQDLFYGYESTHFLHFFGETTSLQFQKLIMRCILAICWFRMANLRTALTLWRFLPQRYQDKSVGVLRQNFILVSLLIGTGAYTHYSTVMELTPITKRRRFIFGGKLLFTQKTSNILLFSLFYEKKKKRDKDLSQN